MLDVHKYTFNLLTLIKYDAYLKFVLYFLFRPILGTSLSEHISGFSCVESVTNYRPIIDL